jgi:hypothetical protein
MSQHLPYDEIRGKQIRKFRTSFGTDDDIIQQKAKCDLHFPKEKQEAN